MVNQEQPSRPKWYKDSLKLTFYSLIAAVVLGLLTFGRDLFDITLGDKPVAATTPASATTPTSTPTPTSTADAPTPPSLQPSEPVTAEPAVDTATPTPTESPASSEPSVFYAGPLLIDYPVWKDLDTNPSSNSDDGNDLGKRGHSTLETHRDALIGPWLPESPSSKNPTFEDCRIAANAAGVRQIQVEEGWYCIKTSEGRIAAFHVREANLSKGIVGRVTVWDLTQ